MPETTQQDLTLTVGDAYNRVFALFSDARIKQWRGEWHELFVYQPGEAVELEPGEVFVCTMRTMSCKPGAPESGEFWSPAAPMDLTDDEFSLVCGEVFTLTEGSGITIAERKLGRVEIEVTPTQTQEAASSERYFVRRIDGAERPSTPIRGTMLFRQP